MGPAVIKGDMNDPQIQLFFDINGAGKFHFVNVQFGRLCPIVSDIFASTEQTSCGSCKT